MFRRPYAQQPASWRPSTLARYGIGTEGFTCTNPTLASWPWRGKNGDLITYDVNTFPLTVKEHLQMGLSHAGMIYVSGRYRQNAIGSIARGLVKVWQAEKSFDWTNRIRFLD
jgi:hypothetical protein